MARVKYEVCAGQKYEKNGETKTKWIRCGTVFENDKGNLSMKLECLPVPFPEWLSFFAPKEKDEQPKERKQQPDRTPNYENEEIPF